MVVNELLVQALEGFLFDVIPSLMVGRPYVLSPTQARLLSGSWPLCEYAAKSVFKDAVSQAESFRLFDVLRQEIDFRKFLIGNNPIDLADRGRDKGVASEDEFVKASAGSVEFDPLYAGYEIEMADLMRGVHFGPYDDQGDFGEDGFDSFDSPW